MSAGWRAALPKVGQQASSRAQEKAEGVGDQACWPCMLAMHVHDLHVSRTKYSGLPRAC